MAEKLCELKKKGGGGGGGGSTTVNAAINIKTISTSGTNATVSITSNYAINLNGADILDSGNILFTEVRSGVPAKTLLGNLAYGTPSWKFTLSADALIDGVAHQAGYVLTWGYSTAIDHTITGIASITVE